MHASIFIKRFVRSSLLATLVALSQVPAVSLAVGEQTGRIEGRVYDKDSKANLPQVDIELSSPALIGGAIHKFTGDDGTFEFRQLQPGLYTAKISMEGLKPIKRQVLVQLGTTTPLVVEWSPEVDQMSENVEVVGQNQMNADSTQSGAVLNASSQAKVASARSYQSVTQQVAGVSGGADPNVMGASALKNRYLIDGLDVTDPVTNTFSSNVNFDSIESLQVLTGGMEAQYNSMGGVINLITNGGSDEFHVDSSIYVNKAELSASNNYGAGLVEGYRPFDTRPQPPTSSLQTNVNINGPLIKQHLWYSLGLQYQNTQVSQPAGPPLNIQAPPSVRTALLPRAKLTFAPVTAHRFTFSAFADPTTLDYVYNGGSRANRITPPASSRQDQGGYSATLQWDYFATSNLTTKLQVGYQEGKINNGPQGKLGTIDFGALKGKYPASDLFYDYNRPGHLNTDDNTEWYNTASNTTDLRKTTNFEGAVIYEFEKAGHHSSQFGVQSRISSHDFAVAIPGNQYFVDSGGGPGEAGLCNTTTGNGCDTRQDTQPYSGSEKGFGIGFYAQDRYKPFQWLTILPGLRFDFGTTTNSAGQLVSNLSGFGPRIGGVWDITRDNKTIFSAFYGRANETLSLLAAATASPTAVTNVNKWDPTTKTFKFDSTTGGPGAIQLDPHNLTAPHSDQIQFGLRRLIANTMTGGIQYTWKRLSNIWDQTEVNTILDPSGTRVVGYKNGMPQQIFLLNTPDKNYNVYQGVDLTMQGNPSPNVNLYAAYTLSFKYGPGGDELGTLGLRSQFFNARQTQFFSGYSFGDVRHQIKLSGSYAMGGFSVGPNISYQSGEVRAATSLVGDTNVGDIQRSPIGTAPGRAPTGTPNSQASITELRTPPLLTVDLRATYELPSFAGLKLTLIGDMFNALNLGGVTEINTNLSVPQYGTASSHQAPLRVQLALRAQY